MTRPQNRLQPEHLTSSLGRLCTLLLEAQLKPAGTDAQVVWKELLGIEGKTEDFLVHYAEILKLVSAARAELSSLHPLERRTCNQVLNSVEHMFMKAAPGEKWDVYRNHLANDALQTLLECVKEISSRSEAMVILPDQLSRMLESVLSLSNEIAGADLPLDLKKTLLEQLNSVHMAIHLYRLRGTKGLVEALDMSLGVIIRYKDDLAKAAETQPSIRRYLHEMVGMTEFANQKIKNRQLWGGC